MFSCHKVLLTLDLCEVVVIDQLGLHVSKDLAVVAADFCLERQREVTNTSNYN